MPSETLSRVIAYQSVGGLALAPVGFALAFVIGIACAKQLAKVKAEGGRGLLVRALYWYTPSDWWLPSLTPSHVREYVGG